MLISTPCESGFRIEPTRTLSVRHLRASSFGLVNLKQADQVTAQSLFVRLATFIYSVQYLFQL